VNKKADDRPGQPKLRPVGFTAREKSPRERGALLGGQQEALIFAQAAVRLLVAKFDFTVTKAPKKEEAAPKATLDHWFEVRGHALSLRRGGTGGRPAN
jgi:hypothetical protein